MTHWTVITPDDGDYHIDCSCGWSAYETTWDDAKDASDTHKDHT